MGKRSETMFIKVTEFDGQEAIIPTTDIKSVRGMALKNIDLKDVSDAFKGHDYVTTIFFGDNKDRVHVHQTVDEVYASIEKAVRLIRPINIG
jgi:hypothetical protein